MTGVETSTSAPFQVPPSPGEVEPSNAVPTVSPAGYWIAGAIWILGIGGAVVWFFITVFALVQAPDDFERIDVPGTRELTLDAGEWVVYHEYPGAGSTFSFEQPDIEVTASDGDEVTVYDINLQQTYQTFDGTEGTAIGEFDVAARDTFTVRVLGEPRFDQQVAVGRPYEDAIDLGHLGWAMLLGIGSFVAGLTVLVVTIVRRGSAKRKRLLATARSGGVPPYGGPGPGWGPPPPQPGWPPPADRRGWGPPPQPPPGGWGPPPPTAPPAQPERPVDPWGNPPS